MGRLAFAFLFLSIVACKQTKVEEPTYEDEVLFEEADQKADDRQDEIINTPVIKKAVRTAFVPSGWIDFPENDLQHLDIRYATENNFVNEQLYPCGKCFLRKEAATALNSVAKSLAQINFKLVLFDCYRPKPIQQKLWDKVPNPSYVTPPHKGSMHNRGVAVDLSIMDSNGEYLDMGTTYDFFGVEAHTDNMNLPAIVLKNRKLLMNLMVKHGFKGIRTEWWHFALASGEYEIADWQWECD